MNLEKGFVYHVFNRGNNGERIFYNSSNYRFFCDKINTYVIPYADVLAWCLMPNHYHLMILVNDELKN
jgi:putative transposase